MKQTWSRLWGGSSLQFNWEHMNMEPHPGPVPKQTEQSQLKSDSPNDYFLSVFPFNSGGGLGDWVGGLKR